MKIWLEVASGDRAWRNKVEGYTSGKKRGLRAPARTRYVNMLKDVQEGDVVLSYLTRTLTLNPLWRSSIIGISMVTSGCRNEGMTLLIDTANDLELPAPIRFYEFKTYDNFSESFAATVGLNMQRYLTKMDEKDFHYLIGLHPANGEFLRRSVYSQIINEPDEDGQIP